MRKEDEMEKVIFRQMRDGVKEEFAFPTTNRNKHIRHATGRLLTARVDNQVAQQRSGI